MNPPPGFVVLTLATGCVCVIPERIYVAGLWLGKQIRRQEAEAEWMFCGGTDGPETPRAPR